MLKRLWLPLLLTAVSCSQGPGSGSSVGSEIESQFIDDPVKGLEFVTSAGSNGKTQALGKFKCIKGEKVGFKIAGLELGEAVCGERIFVDDLESDEPDHSPEKVAAIIQSFGVPGSDQIDLSVAVEKMSPTALAALSFAGNNTAFASALSTKVSDIKIAVPELVSVIEAKDPDDMRDILDAAIAAYSSLSDAFKTALGISAHAPSASFSQIVAAEKMMTLTGTLSSNDPNDLCYDFIQGRVSVSQDGSDKPFKFVVHRIASFDALDSYDNVTNLCKESGWCDQETELPSPKLITSSSISFFTEESGTEEGDTDADDVVWSSETVAQLNASIQGGELVIAGSLEEKGEYTKTGESKESYSCKYSVTSSEVAIPAEGDYPEDESDSGWGPVAAVGNWTGDITTCSNPSEFDLRSVTNGEVIIAQDSSNSDNIYPQMILSTTLHGVGTVPDGVYTQSNYNSSGHWVISQMYTAGRFEAVFAGPSSFTFNYYDASDNSCGGTFSLVP